jgi:glycosyltransferase involved in cell wall biosynthesis
MKKKIIVVGPALSQTGYGEQCRFALRALLEYDDIFDIYLKPLPWGNSSWIAANDKRRGWLDSLVRKTAFHIQNGGSFDVSLQVTIPNEWQKIAPINIGYTAGIETTRVTPEWLEKSKLIDKIITISKHSKDVYLETSYDAEIEGTGQVVKLKCDVPIDVVHYPVVHAEPEEIDIDLEYDFNFLVMAQWGPRKNIENTIKWWIEEFKNEKVGLVVKTNLVKTSVVDRYHTKQRIESLISSFGEMECKIYLIHGNMTRGELTAMYQHPKIKCLVSLTHGEGFGLPLFEAAYNGLPVIAPDWSGQKDFLYAPKKVTKKGKTTTKTVAHFGKVAYDISKIQKQVAWKGVLHEDASWCYAKKDSYRKNLRSVYSDYGRFRNQAKSLKRFINTNFTEQKKYKDMVDSIKEVCGFEMHDEIDSLFEEAMQGK